MGSFLFTFDATTSFSGGNAPLLEMLIGGTVVSSVEMQAGSQRYDVLLDYAGISPSSFSIRFSGSSGDPGDSINITSASINNTALNTGSDLTATLLAQSQSAAVSAANSLFGHVTPTLPAPDVSGTGGDDDSLNGSNAADSVDGLAGNDRIRGLGGDDAINGGDGADFIFGEGGVDTILGGNGNDILFGNAGNDILYGEANDDYVIGGDGDDLLNGGTGNDVLVGDAGNDILFGEDGADTLIGDIGDDLLFGDGGNDILIGGADNDSMAGGDGDDQLMGEAGNDLLSGGAGADEIFGGTGNDIASGGAGDDSIFGGDGNDELAGGDDNDTINGGAGDDDLSGDAGNDVLIGGGGADTINGGTGDDVLHGHGLDETTISTILYNNPNVVYNQQTGSFYQYVTTAETWDDANSAALSATLNGNTGHLVTITSQAENDYIQSLISGNIWLASNDTTNESEWAWTSGLEGGIQFWSGLSGGSAVNGMYENWNSGEPNEFNTGEDYIEFRSVDGLWNDNGGPQNPGLTNGYVIEWEAGFMGDDGVADVLSGGAGNDTLYGYDGDDTLNGDANADILVGGAGSDTLNGGDGNDVLYAYDGSAVDSQELMGGSSSAGGYTVADALAENPNVVYNSTTGNFYEYVNANTTYANAVSGATSSTLNGVAGHLATITSAAENTFITGIISGNSWLGGDDTGTEDDWYWNTGPEAGTQFSTGSTAEPGQYENWAGGQPNDWGGGQDYFQIQTNGTWADFAASDNDDYVIEWEGSDVITSFGGGGPTVTVLDEGFSSDAGGFIYADGVYGSAGASNSYADGTRITTDGDTTANGALEVTLGGIDNNDLSTMSGAFQQTITVSENITSVSLSFSYRVLDAVVDSDPFDTGEDTQLYVDIDGTTYSNDANPYFFEITGSAAGTNYDSGWQNITLSIGSLNTGTYDLSIGALLLDKTWDSEEMQIRFDDILLEGSGESSGSGGSAGSNPGADAGQINILNGGNGNDTLYGGGGTDTLNGDAGADTIYSGANETLTATINSILAANSGVVYSEDTNSFYQYVNSNTNWASANSAASSATLSGLTGVNGHLVTITSQAENDYVDSIIGNTIWIGATDSATEGVWQWVTGPESGIQFSNGSGTSVNSWYENWDGGQPNDWGSGQDTAEMQTDGTWTDATGNNRYVIEWEADSLLSTVEKTTLNGGAGDDTLYGNDGIDIFVFDNTSSQDTIYNFDTVGRDQIDLSSILSSYDPLSNDINNFIQLTESGGNTTLAVDTNGSAGGASFTNIATIDSVTGLDLYQMIAADNLITS